MIQHRPHTQATTLVFTCFLSACLILPEIASAAQITSASKTAGAAAQVRILEQDGEHLVLELNIAPASLSIQRDEEANCDLPEMVGLTLDAAPGLPDLPAKSILLGIPPAGGVTVQVSAVESIDWPQAIDACAIATPAIAQAPAGPLPTAHVRYVPLSAADSDLVPAAAEVEVLGFVRGQRMARLRLNPLQYDAVERRLRISTTLRLDVRFEASTAGAAAMAQSDPGDLWLQGLLLNEDQAKRWRTRGETTVQCSEAAAGPLLKLSLAVPGMYRLAYGDLAQAGLDVAHIDPRRLQLSNRGRAVAMHVTGEEDGSFDPPDAIEFYGVPAGTPYTDTNAYWLNSESAPGLRMAEKDGQPVAGGQLATSFRSVLRLETDSIYWPAPSPSSGRDYWFWNRLYATNGAVSLSTPVFLTDVIATEPALLRVGVKSRGDTATNPDHHLRLRLNGQSLGDTTWDGESPRVIEAAVPAGYLAGQANTLSLELPGDTGAPYDIVYLDWIEVEYSRTLHTSGDVLAFAGSGPGAWTYRLPGFTSPDVSVWDVSDPGQPAIVAHVSVVQEAGGSYTAVFADNSSGAHRYLAATAQQTMTPATEPAMPAHLRSASRGADYIAITDRDFYTATLPLVQHRQAGGMRAVLVTTDDVYNEFGDGLFDPSAIRSFLAYAYACWAAPAPGYVALVGDGTVDFRNNLGAGTRNVVPPLMAQVDPWLGETASDNLYIAVSGDDPLPDMAIGRLPAKSPQEVADMIAKIMAYEETPEHAAWQNRALYVADNADEAGDFAAVAAGLARQLPPPMTAEAVYLGVNYSSPAAATQTIVSALNSGQLLVNYVGHAAVQFWAAERLFDASLIPALSHRAGLPLLLAWSCYEGWFIYPGLESLDESLVRAPGAGAIAAWGPAGMGVESGHSELARQFYSAVFTEHITRIGAATTRAKIAFYGQVTQNRDLVDTYVLFGDPALELRVDWQYRVSLPLVVR